MVYFRLIRVRQWIKNGFLLLPLFFSGEFLNFEKLPELLIGILAFSLVSSSIYIFNDSRDVESDKLHPKKKFRPLASGEVSIITALIISLLCFSIGFTTAYILKAKFAFVLGIYFIMNLAYSGGLKKIPILDIIIISIGFVLRVKAGGVIANIAISQWLMVMVFLLALFLAIAKRRDDLVLNQEEGVEMRKASKGYNMEYLTAMLTMISGIIVVCYLLYTLDQGVIARIGTYRLYYTVVFVIAGIMRYLQLALVENNTGSPTELLYKDTVIQLAILGWIISYGLILYFPQVSFFE